MLSEMIQRMLEGDRRRCPVGTHRLTVTCLRIYLRLSEVWQVLAPSIMIYTESHTIRAGKVRALGNIIFCGSRKSAIVKHAAQYEFHYVGSSVFLASRIAALKTETKSILLESRIGECIFSALVVAACLSAASQSVAQNLQLECQEKLSALISNIDREIKAAPSGPIDGVRNYTESFRPINGCDLRTFHDGVKRSDYFLQVDEMPKYDIAIITNGNVEVGISYYREDESIKKVYAMIRK
jgi:hypothetical protein